MKRYIILWLFLVSSYLGYAQKCGLDAPFPILLDQTLTYDLIVDETQYLVTDLASNPLCEVEIFFTNYVVFDMELSLISPAGERIMLIGPNNSPIEFTNHTILSKFDVSFVRDGDAAKPDTEFLGLGDRWDNTILPFRSGVTYTGSYKPFAGRLEDFVTGGIGGVWQLEITNNSLINTDVNPNEILDVRLIFCDESGAPPCCDADAGFINTSLNIMACAGDDTLDIRNIGPGYTLRRPDTLEYGYRFLIGQNGILVGNDSISDLRSFAPGTYEICGFSFNRSEVDRIPAPNGTLTINDIRNDLTGAAPSLCADITSDCITVVINGSSPTTFLNEVICPGDSLFIGDSTFTSAGDFEVLLSNQSGCDSLINLALTVAEVTRDTLTEIICPGETFSVGPSIYDASGIYSDTLQSVNLCDSIILLNLTVAPPQNTQLNETICAGDTIVIGAESFSSSGNYQVILSSALSCDSIIDLELTVLAPQAIVPEPATISCSLPEITLDGSNSTGSAALTFQWSDLSGNTIGNDALQIIDTPGEYVLEVGMSAAGTTCVSQDTISVSGDLQTPVADAGPPDTINCFTPEVTIGSNNSSQGTEFSYTWATTGGSFSSATDIPQPSVNGPGEYRLTVLNTDNGCSSTDTVDIVADLLAPVASAGPGQTLDCNRSTVILDGSRTTLDANTTFEWGSDNGSVLSAANTLMPETTLPDRYWLALTNNENGCVDTAFVTVGIDTTGPNLVITPVPNLNCEVRSLQIDATGSDQGGIFTFSWDTADGANISAGENTLSPVADRAGEYELSIENTINGCISTRAIRVEDTTNTIQTAIANPEILTCAVATTTLDASGSSAGPDIIYNWSTIDGNILSPTDGAAIEINEPGQYRLTVLDTLTRCSASEAITANASRTLPLAVAGRDSTLTCRAATIPLDGSGSTTGAGIVYQWSGPGFIDEPATINTFTSEPGEYILQVTETATGCTASDTIAIDQNTETPQIVELSANDLSCAEKSTSLNVVATTPSGLSTLKFALSGPGISIESDTFPLLLTRPGLYTVVVTDTLNGCGVSESITINADSDFPRADPGPDQVLTCDVSEVILGGPNTSSGPEFTYSWFSTEGNLTGPADAASTTANQSGVYGFIVTNTNNSCADTAFANILVDTLSPFVDGGTDQQLSCSVSLVTLDGTSSDTGPELQYTWTGPCLDTPADQPSVQVSCEGTYLLRVDNTVTGCSSADTVLVSLDDNFPMAVVANTAEISCNTGSVTLDGSASEGGTPEWFFAGTSLGTSSLTPVVADTGTYTLVVTNLIAGCSDTATVEVSFNCRPSVNLVAAPVPISCDQRAAELIAEVQPVGPDYIYEWTSSVSGDCFLGTQDQPSVQVSCPDTYRLIVTNPVFDLADTLVVTVAGDTTNPTLSIMTPAPITCTDPTTVIDASNSSAGPEFLYTWTNPQGDTISDQTTVEIDSGGIYTLEITDARNGCRVIDVVEVIDEQFRPDITFSTGVFPCFQDTLSLSAEVFPPTADYRFGWSGPGIQSGNDSSTVLINQPGSYELEITEPATGCVATESINVSQPACPPCLDLASPLELTCNQPTQTLALTFCEPCNGCLVQWTTVDGQIDVGADTPTPQISQPGTYVVTATNPQGLNSRMTIVVNGDFELPAADAGPDRELSCRNTEVTVGELFSVGPEFVYRWTDESQQQLSDQPALTSMNPGIFTFTVIDTTNGCLSSDDVSITIDTISPIIDIVPPTILDCTNPAVTLDASASTIAHDAIFSWVSDADSSINGAATPTPTIGSPGEYLLSIEDSVNGCRSSEMVTVMANFAPPTVNNIPGAILNCRDITATLTGNIPAPSGFDVLWCRQEPDGSLSGCNATIDLLVAEAGTFIFQVTDQANGCDSSVQVVVEEDTQAPVVEAGSADTLTCIKNSVQLSGSIDLPGSVPLRLSWSSAGNSMISDNTVPDPLITSPDTYFLTATNEENFCTATDSVIISENLQFPDADAGPDRTLTCAPAAIELAGEASSLHGSTIVSWSTDNGSILSATGTTTITVNRAGIYRLAVADPLNGCMSTDEVVVAADTDPPTAVIDNSTPLSLNCERDTIILDASPSFAIGGGTLNYQWNAISSESPILGGVASERVRVTGLGIYRLIVENPLNNCRDTLDLTVEGDFAQPRISLPPPPPLTCEVSTITLNASGSDIGSNFVYSWRAPGGELLITDSNSIEVDQAGEYELSLLNVINGCSSSTTTVVQADTTPPVVAIEVPDILDCISRTTFIDGRSSSSGDQFQYTWTTPNGNILSGQDSVVATAAAPGNYSLRIDNLRNGCFAEDGTEVVEIANPISGALILTTDPQCLNDNNGSIVIESVNSGTDPFTYSIEDRTFISNNQFSNLGAGDYRLTIQGSDGCSYETTVTLNSPLDIGVDLGPDQTINLGDSTSLVARVSGSPPDSLQWMPGNGLEDPLALTQTVKPQKNSLYGITVINENGCTASDQVLIKVNTAKELFFPTAFSPDGDEKNDRFTISAGNNVRLINRLQIFSRWGTLVYSQESFQPNDATIGWDGTYNGQLLNPAVFVFIAEVEFIDGTVQMFQGDIALMR